MSCSRVDACILATRNECEDTAGTSMRTHIVGRIRTHIVGSTEPCILVGSTEPCILATRNEYGDTHSSSTRTHIQP